MPKRLAPSLAPRRLEIGAAKPGLPILEDVIGYLRGEGFIPAADALSRHFPNRLREHVTVSDAHYVGAAIRPEAAVVAAFGPIQGRGADVAAQSWRDAALFVQTEEVLPDLRDLLAELDEHWATMRPLMDDLRAFLAGIDIAPGVPTAPGEQEVHGA